ncbi:MAG: GltB/FmdC/FwdC-like GXGXG domain-containing protein [Desulfitobacteriaceae bacterium]
MSVLNGKGVYYRELNETIRAQFASGADEVRVLNVNGQRYIGDGVRGNKQRLVLEGTPGNDMAAYMDGLEIIVQGNAQDSMANTMNEGKIIVHGHAGDTVGYAMRGGEIYIRDGVGYRVGIHMKEYMDKIPAIIIGGKAGEFFGEYMAGGILMLLGLGLEEGQEIVGSYCGTGMHGGVMYIRGDVAEYKLGKEVKIVELTPEDEEKIRYYVSEYVQHFGGDGEEILSKSFNKLIPYNKRPYGNLYCWW